MFNNFTVNETLSKMHLHMK